MASVYRHTQTGRLLRWASIAPAISVAVGGFLAGKPLLFALLAALFCAIGWIFSALTVEVSEMELIWFFGPGFWRQRVMRGEIVSATPVRAKWWWGWGIHRTPRGWLYNVAGLDSVEIALLGGRRVLIGSDEAAALAKAVMQR